MKYVSMYVCCYFCYRRDDEASLMDPSVSGSTVTLMAHSAECDESLQGINNIPSPVITCIVILDLCDL